MSAHHPTLSLPVFSKIARVPDLLWDGGSLLSLYTDDQQVLHMQCRLRKSGILVLFPVTFRLVNRYLSGDFSLAQVLAQAPGDHVMIVTQRHNFLEVSKQEFDASQLVFAHKRYPQIRFCKVADLDDIRRGLHDCMRA